MKTYFFIEITESPVLPGFDCDGIFAEPSHTCIRVRRTRNPHTATSMLYATAAAANAAAKRDYDYARTHAAHYDTIELQLYR